MESQKQYKPQHYFTGWLHKVIEMNSINTLTFSTETKGKLFYILVILR